MADICKLFGKHLRALRKVRKMTQEELGEHCTLTPQYICALERGLKNPSLDTLDKLASGLSLPLYRLFTIPETESDPEGKIVSYVSEADPDSKRKMLTAVRLFVD
jgi:transcriptional regulator with XRE-family HTH domain